VDRPKNASKSDNPADYPGKIAPAWKVQNTGPPVLLTKEYKKYWIGNSRKHTLTRPHLFIIYYGIFCRYFLFALGPDYFFLINGN